MEPYGMGSTPIWLIWVTWFLFLEMVCIRTGGLREAEFIWHIIPITSHFIYPIFHLFVVNFEEAFIVVYTFSKKKITLLYSAQ